MPGRRETARLAGALAATALLAPAPALALEHPDPAPVYPPDRVYVSDSLARAVPPEDLGRLREEVAAMPMPTFVVIAPTFGDKRDPDVADDLTFAMWSGSGAGDGLFIWLDERGAPAAARYEDSQPTPAGDLRSAALGVPARDGLPARASAMLAVARGVVPRPRDDAPEDPGPPAWGILLVGLAVFGGLTLTWRQRPAPLGGHEEPGRVAEPPLQDARMAARAALLELQRAVAREDAPPEEVFDAYRAASKAIDEARRPIDAAGAQALAESGGRRLAGEEPRPCFFDPRHGAGAQRVTFDRDAIAVEVPACERCSRALRNGRAPWSLLDGGRPYWEQDTLWARTGCGALDAGLAARVLAGDAR